MILDAERLTECIWQEPFLLCHLIEEGYGGHGDKEGSWERGQIGPFIWSLLLP